MAQSLGRMTAGLAGAAVLLSGCGVTGALAGNEPAKVTVSAANGATGVRPDALMVKASSGKLDKVSVQGMSGPVAGTFHKGRTEWRASRPLTPSQKYTVTVTAKNGGKATSVTSTFETLKPAKTADITDVTPVVQGETVGVGTPIIVKFSAPVSDRATAERALEVKAEKPVEGAWRWVGNDQAIYRTKTYWPAHQKVTFTGRLAGVALVGDTYGTKDITKTLKIGAARISTVNTQSHRMTVEVDGKQVKSAPISAGKGGQRKYMTTNGVHLAMARQDPVTMTSGWMGVTKPGQPGYYKKTVHHAVQISDSGEYVHSAPWSVGSQGNANVSHGCVNAPPDFAQWFYSSSNRGDVVKITGTDRNLEWNNGWGFWQMPWNEWKKGSALR